MGRRINLCIDGCDECPFHEGSDCNYMRCHQPGWFSDSVKQGDKFPDWCPLPIEERDDN